MALVLGADGTQKCHPLRPRMAGALNPAPDSATAISTLHPGDPEAQPTDHHRKQSRPV